MNSLTYTIDLIPENAEKIDQINHIILGTDYTQETSVTESTVGSDESVNATVNATLTKKQVSDAVKAAKAEHGEDYVNACVKSLGIEPAKTIGHSVRKIDTGDYSKFVGFLVTGPTVKVASEEPKPTPEEPVDELDFEDDDEPEVPATPEIVQDALKALAKDKGRDAAKALMKANGMKKLADAEQLSQSKLNAIMKACV